MTRTEARKALMKAYPGYSVCIQIADWHYMEGHDAITFTVFVQPYDSTDPDAVEVHTGDTLEEAVNKALAAASKELEIDRYFAVS